MNIYLAARYSRRDQLRSLRDELHRLGHVVTSRWLETKFGNQPGESSAAPPEYRARYAIIDLQDIEAADALVCFTEQPRQEPKSAGSGKCGCFLWLEGRHRQEK